MLLAIDIGNTNLVIGCIENDTILFKARIATDRLRTSDQYGVEIKNMIEAFGVKIEDKGKDKKSIWKFYDKDQYIKEKQQQQELMEK